MIKRTQLQLVALIFLGLMTTQLYAATFWDYRDVKQFPIQQSIIEPVRQSWIGPGEMTSWGFGKSYVYYYPSFSSLFSVKGSKFCRRPTHVYELKRDFPFKKSNSSFGMDITLFQDFIKGASSNNGRFSDFRGFDILGNYKFKVTIATSVGDIIGIVIPKLGIAGIYQGLDETKQRINNIYYPLGFGTAMGIGLGIDYYPSQWLGGFIECNIKWVHIISWLTSPLDTEQDPYTGYKYQKESYSYYPAAITFGLKTTF